jgi:hypothetical protein
VFIEKLFIFIYFLNGCYDAMSATEVLKKFDELEVAMKTHLPKVDPPLVVDLILRQKREKKDPIYTLEVFIKPNQNTEVIRDRIIKDTGMAPAFYDSGTHVVVAHRINFELLKMINDIDFVETIKGTYSGGGMVSIGPTYER